MRFSGDFLRRWNERLIRSAAYSEEPGAGFVSEDGRGERFERDFDGRIIKITDDAGHVRTYTYDAEGNLSAYTDGAGNTVTNLCVN